MRFSSLLLALLPAALAVNIAIQVGVDDNLTFTPVQTTANIGDTLTFTFVSKNHSVTTTTFSGHVCPPPNGGVGPNGWDSGFMPVLNPGDPELTFVYTVVDTAPHFASCKQDGGTHCRSGMTFALNPTADMTWDEFIINAIES
ncbi:hypothetical protein FB45DRAFT_297902 [Roridomyces roridus]|uniref:Extracellular serine-rich protein n=1 Tax=Roridomyces roridus TaxID=1738132 RepID=A0AAD7CBU0_9AGAR|nr:hypothetical protein FB45DRAFT_297902 [Roridomyces roridus]